jgi:hypothetical protein
MGQTVKGFHGALADMLIKAKTVHDARPKPGEPGYLNQASQDAVTIFRRIAHLASGYANGEAKRGIRPTWEAFWRDGIDRRGYVRLLDTRTRFKRCDADGEAATYDDSVTYWEWSLARAVMWTDHLIPEARKTGNPETIARITLDHAVTVRLAAAYTGLDVGDVRRAMAEAEGAEVDPPTYHGGGREYPAHPVFELITAGRPTV